MTSRDDENGELNEEEEAGQFALYDAGVFQTINNMPTEKRDCLNIQEINLGNSNITKFSIEVDSFKDLNKPLCSFSIAASQRIIKRCPLSISITTTTRSPNSKIGDSRRCVTV